MWRHGDVFIARVDVIPKQAFPRGDGILAHGEVTGHSHRLEKPSAAELWELGEQLFLRVVAPSVRVVHEEHKPIILPRGTYRVWQQREYSPEAIRRVLD
ncbi:MAG: hypothetical protein JO112_18525 [Planctomycetes bacterium]|nr:hypothetical protein [Planctomycetota bacterium]